MAVAQPETAGEYLERGRAEWQERNGHPADREKMERPEVTAGMRPIQRVTLAALKIPGVASRFDVEVPARYIETRLPAVDWIVSCPDDGPVVVPFGEFVACECGRTFLRTETRVLVARP